MVAKQGGNSFCSARAYRAGINFRAVRSPEAPKITMVHAPGTE